MKGDRLEEIFNLAYWSTRTAADVMQVDSRVVRRWLSGDAPIPPPLEAWLEELEALLVRIPRPPPRGE